MVDLAEELLELGTEDKQGVLEKATQVYYPFPCIADDTFHSC